MNMLHCNLITQIFLHYTMKHRKHFYISIKYIFSIWVGSIVEITPSCLPGYPLSGILFRTIKEGDINTLALFLLREVIVTTMKLFLSRGLLSSGAADYLIFLNFFLVKKIISDRKV